MNSLLSSRPSSSWYSWGSLAGIGLALIGCYSGRGAESLKTESRTPYHHVIPLRDAAGNQVILPPEVDEQGKPQEPRGNPFSTRETCGKCHQYQVISQGWHFNAATSKAKPGRPGEAWVLTDPATRTQIPISYRGWTGTFKPADLGISDYDFLVAFARHYPGGGVGEPAMDQIQTSDARMRRFLVTGALEIDCLICHTRQGEYDHEARAKSLAYENLKWTATVASELGVYGASRPGKAFADGWRPPRPAPTNLPPVKYDRERFNSANEVAFSVTRRPAPENCYFCHTSKSKIGDARWHGDADVHIRAGMTCADCHRNGIDHMVVRGYEGEVRDRVITDEMKEIRAKMLMRDDASLKETEAKQRAEAQIKGEMGMVETLSCRGCHYGSEDGTAPGRLGAPHPAHVGFPPVHFERLTCTACHSGPIPKDTLEIVQTSMAHRLGLPGPARGANTAPVIVEPAFLRDANGKIAPHKLVWPSYWGYLKDNKVTPLLPEVVAKTAGEKLPKQAAEDAERDPYNTRPLTEAQIKDVLQALAPASTPSTNGEAVFLAAGKLYRLAGEQVKAEEHDAAKPYSWAIGHDVRPASQAVGVKGCADCHAQDSPIYFASVLARGPVDPTNGVLRTQWAMRGDDEKVASTFAFTFNFRPMLKVMTFACAALIAGVLLSHGLAGLRRARGLRDPEAE